MKLNLQPKKPYKNLGKKIPRFNFSTYLTVFIMLFFSYSAQAQIESALREIILSTWDMASILLAKATSFCAGKGPNIETLCRHIDYVLTGRFRSIQDNALLPSHLERSKDAPPADLFDNLLSELQKRK